MTIGRQYGWNIIHFNSFPLNQHEADQIVQELLKDGYTSVHPRRYTNGTYEFRCWAIAPVMKIIAQHYNTTYVSVVDEEIPESLDELESIFLQEE